MNGNRPSKKKHIFTLFAAVMSAALVFTACSSNSGNGGNNAGSASNNSANAAEETPVQQDPVGFKYDPPIEVSTAMIFEQQTETDFKPGETIEDNVHTRWMRDTLGIDLSYDFIVAKREDHDTKLRLMLAGKNELPDVMKVSTELANDLIASKKVMPLNDLIETYLSPNLKALYEQYPGVLYPVTKDGKIYGLPNMYAMDEGTVMWVRQDWLDNLGLKAPATIEEFEEVIRAFTEDDPDRNGKDDTLGLAVSLKDGMYQWVSSADGIMGAFTDHVAQSGSMDMFWHENEEGKLEYGTIQPSLKPFLAAMNKWMEAGWIDPEAGIKDAAKATEIAASGQAGIIFGPFWMNGYPLSGVPEFQPYPNPTGPKGSAGRAEKAMVHDYVMFNSDFEHPEAILGYISKLFAMNFGEDDPYYDPFFKDGFHEGYDYVRHEGKIIRSDFEGAGVPKDKWPAPNDGKVAVRVHLPLTGATFVPYLGDAAFQKFKDNPDAEVLNAMEARVQASQPRQLEAGLVRISQNDTAIHNKYGGPPTATMESKGELLTKLETESYLKIIYGDEPLDYFDEFVKQWKANGGDQITQEVNEWYEGTK